MDEGDEREMEALNRLTFAVMTAVEMGVPPTIVRETVEEAISEAGGGA